MTLPPIKAGVQESVQAYVLRRLVDAGKALTSEEIAEGVPSHFSPSSVSKACSRLYAIAVLGRQRLVNGKKGVTYQWYVADLNRIPKDFCWEAHPERSHSKPRPRRKPTTEPSPLNGQHDGVAHIQEEPVACTADPSLAAALTFRYSPDGAAYTPHIPGVTARPSVAATSKPADPPPTLAERVDAHVEAQHAKTYTEPMLVFPTPKGLRRMTVAEAKALYRQLHEVFG